jgi:hypothetical protein
MRRILVAVALSVCIVLIMRHSPVVDAYVTSGHAWATTQVPFYVNPDNLYVTANDAISALQRAASNWSSQSSANVQLVYAGTTSGSSAVLNYKNEMFFRNESNGSLAAVTYWWYDATGHLVDADTIYYEGSYVFFTNNSGCQGAGEYIDDVGTHEFGHVLGLAHTPVVTATMYPTNTYCDTSWETLDPDDVSGIEFLYPPTGNTTSPTPPAAPSGLTAVADASNPASSVSLAWIDNATNANSYSVQRGLDGSSFANIVQLGSSATSYVDGGLSGGTTYYYRIKASNSSGWTYSNIASAQTLTSAPPPPTSTPQPPGVPSGPSPADGATNVNAANATLSWGTVSGAQAYDVYFGTTNTPGLYLSNVTGSSVRAPSMSSGATYYWMVIAKNNAGSTASPPWSFTTKGTGKK